MKFVLGLPKKYLIIGAIIIVALGFFAFKPKTNQVKYQFADVKKQDIKSIVSSSGSLTGKDTANLKFKSAGKLSYLSVKAGNLIQQGEVIAGLDTQDLSIKLQQAYNTLRDKQAIVDKILDDVKDHAKDESFTQKQNRTTAEATRDSAYDSVKDAQRAFQDAVLIAPISGLVTQANGLVGQNVSSSDLIAQIVDNSQIIFDTDIDESDIGKISVGQRAEVILDAYENEKFKGQVSQILPQTKTTSSGATVVTVRVSLSTTPKTFVNGLTGQADIILAEVQNALTIPQEALRDDNTVVVGQTQNLHSVKVTPGIKSDTDVEIKEGLKDGDKVLLNPPTSLGSSFQFRLGGPGGSGGGVNVSR